MLPEWLPSKWLMLFTQPWEGDITVTLPASLWQLGKTIVNPTEKEVLHSIRVSGIVGNTETVVNSVNLTQGTQFNGSEQPAVQAIQGARMS